MDTDHNLGLGEGWGVLHNQLKYKHDILPPLGIHLMGNPKRRLTDGLPIRNYVLESGFLPIYLQIGGFLHS